MMAYSFMPPGADRYSQNYKNTTPSRKDRLDTCLFAANSHNTCPFAASVLAGVFGRHGSSLQTNASTKGGLCDE